VNVHLLPAGTLFLHTSQITLHAVMGRLMEQKMATSTVQLELDVSWIDICLDVVIGPATNFHMNDVKLSLNIRCASYPIPELNIHIEHTLASCCYFNIISYLLYCLHVTNCVWSSNSHQSTFKTWQWGSDQCWQLSGLELLYNTQHTTEIVHYMPRMNSWQMPSVASWDSESGEATISFNEHMEENYIMFLM
jgi:hypothetical protein